MLVYCTGMSHPAKGTIFAPSRTCSSESGVFLGATVSLTRQSKQRSDCMQRWIGFSEDDGRGFAKGANVRRQAAFIAIALRTTRSTLRANCGPLPCVAMTWLDKLERRLRFLAVPGLMRIVVAFNALVFLLVRLNPGFRFVVDLDPGRIRHGEIWRLITYIFLPQTDSFLWVFLLLWFLWFIGEGLEQAWGAFRLTLYFIVGMIGTTAAACFFG